MLYYNPACIRKEAFPSTTRPASETQILPVNTSEATDCTGLQAGKHHFGKFMREYWVILVLALHKRKMQVGNVPNDEFRI